MKRLGAWYDVTGKSWYLPNSTLRRLRGASDHVPVCGFDADAKCNMWFVSAEALAPYRSYLGLTDADADTGLLPLPAPPPITTRGWDLARTGEGAATSTSNLS